MNSRMRRISVQAVAVVAIATTVALMGCSKKAETPTAPPAADAPTAPPAPPPDREIKIVDVKPDGDSLKAGDTVKLVIGGTYRVPDPGGAIGIVVQDSKSAMLANRLTTVAAGSGKFNETVEFTVPATERVIVHVPLYLKGESKSTTVALREYAVTPK
jgi:hypothetical protein